MKRSMILTASRFIFLFFAIMISARAQSSGAPFTSLWNDYKTSVPAGWGVTYDNEATHYAKATFTSRENGYSMSIRWYTRYSTRRMPDGVLEMFSGPDNFIEQKTGAAGGVGSPDVVTPARDVTVGGIKAQVVVIRSNRQNPENPREGAYTLVPMPSGFFVLTYFAPPGGYDQYKAAYDEMVSSFVALKDGPGGAVLPGAAVPAETPAQTLDRYSSAIKGQRNQDLREPVCKQERGLDSHGDLATLTKCSPLFANMELRRQIIEFAAKMQPPPVIPEEAKRYLVEGNVFLKGAVGAADYKLAIGRFKEALVEAPWWGDAYNNLGVALKAAGRLDDAKTALGLYLLTSPPDASRAQTKLYEIGAQEQLAEEHRRQNEEGQAQFSREVDQGVTDYRNHNYDAAIEHYKKALEASPDHPQAYTAYCDLAAAYAGKNDLDNALKAIQKGVELKPDDINCNGEMADILWFRGDHPASCQYYKKVCDLGAEEGCKRVRNLCQ